MNIHNLVVSCGVAAAALSGCASIEQTAAPSSAGTPIDYSCEPGLAANWPEGEEPDYILEASAKGWDVSTVKVGDLLVTYNRSCSAGVRGPVSKNYPLGPYLGHVDCKVDKPVNLFGYPQLSDSPDYTQELVDQARIVIDQLLQSTACSDKLIKPVG